MLQGSHTPGPVFKFKIQDYFRTFSRLFFRKFKTHFFRIWRVANILNCVKKKMVQIDILFLHFYYSYVTYKNGHKILNIGPTDFRQRFLETSQWYYITLINQLFPTLWPNSTLFEVGYPTPCYPRLFMTFPILWEPCVLLRFIPHLFLHFTSDKEKVKNIHRFQDNYCTHLFQHFSPYILTLYKILHDSHHFADIHEFIFTFSLCLAPH